jgi:hypothetical protein
MSKELIEQLAKELIEKSKLQAAFVLLLEHYQFGEFVEARPLVMQMIELIENAKAYQAVAPIDNVAEALKADAKRYRYLRDVPCWNVELVNADGTKASKAEKFASHFVRKYDEMTNEWSVAFNTDYGMTESEDSLDKAIDSAINSLIPDTQANRTEG